MTQVDVAQVAEQAGQDGVFSNRLDVALMNRALLAGGPLHQRVQIGVFQRLSGCRIEQEWWPTALTLTTQQKVPRKRHAPYLCIATFPSCLG